MKYLGVLGFVLASTAVCQSVRAETPAAAPPLLPVRIVVPNVASAEAAAARDAHLQFERQAMTTLLGWSVASVATGAMLLATGGDDYVRGVGLQNVAWGAIDGVIAGFGYRGIRKQGLLDKPVEHWRAEERKTRKIFLINAGIDVLYVATGAALWHFGKTDFVRGSGAGVMLQGSFLFVFDSAMGIAPTFTRP